MLPFLVRLQAQEVGDGSFKYGFVVIDKSKTEMAAVRLLQNSGDALGWLLCYFHMLQDWERFLSSAESGVSEKKARHAIMMKLAALAHVRDKTVFQGNVSSWHACTATTSSMAQPPQQASPSGHDCRYRISTLRTPLTPRSWHA